MSLQDDGDIITGISENVYYLLLELLVYVQ